MRCRRICLGITTWALGTVFIAAPALVQADDKPETIVKINQGWSDKQKANWYMLSQGSRLIPYDWLFALEQADSEKLFLDAENIKKYRYLPTVTAPQIGLPVGFAVDVQNDSRLSYTRLQWKEPQATTEKWVGMNCAACHTAEITYQGKRMRIEGGPTLGDFQSFMLALNEALMKTRSDPDKNKRFSEKVLKGNNENRVKLNRALEQLIAWQTTVEDANKTALIYGFGRLDAFGHIFNKVAIAAKKDGVTQTYHPSNAPVSYPFLWNIPQHDRVQWNGIAKKILLGNYDVGALGRNVGEVTGVFADVTWFVPNIPSDSNIISSPSIRSSAKVDNLNLLEKQLNTLRPPLWPTGVLGVIDDVKRDRGRELFINKERKNADGSPAIACSECHKGLPRNNLTLPIKAHMIPLKEIGTDIWMACNAVTHEASTGVLFNSVKTPLGGIYGETAPLSTLLTTTVADTVLGNLGSVFRGVRESFSSRASPGLGSSDDAVSNLPANERPRTRCLTGTDPLLAYKARPLTGIWATAPYLHNGSVPTLYDLLLPPDQRPKSFPVGTREFDPKRVGFVTRDADGKMAAPSGDNSFVFQVRGADGSTINGNSNTGHDYGNVTLSDDDRWALVEYMKGL